MRNISNVALNMKFDMWHNWNQTHYGPGMMIQPKNIKELVAVCSRSKFANRASGSRWSSSRAALAETGAWINTSKLDKIYKINLQNSADLVKGSTKAENLVLVQAGIKLHKLVEVLWEKGYSMPSLGGEIGQSLGGVISTSTHGSDIDLPPLGGIVRAIHLVTPNGKEYWIEDDTNPIISSGNLKNIYGSDWDDCIIIRRSSDLFNAVAVSAGRCGVIFSVIIEVEPKFKLKAIRIQKDWKEIEQMLINAAHSDNWQDYIRSKAPNGYSQAQFFDVALNPDSSHNSSWISYRKRVSLSTPDTLKDDMSYHDKSILVSETVRWFDGDAGGVLGSLFGFLLGGPVGAILGGIIGGTAGASADKELWKVISDVIFKFNIGDGEDVGKNYELSSGKKEPYSSYEAKYQSFWKEMTKAVYLEVCFDANRLEYIDFVNKIRSIITNSSHKQGGYISLRFMKQSPAFLAMQRWPVTVSVELVLLKQFEGAEAIIHVIKNLAMQYKDVRFHLGMNLPEFVYNNNFRNDIEEWKKNVRKIGIELNDDFSTSFTKLLNLEPSKVSKKDSLLLFN